MINVRPARPEDWEQIKHLVKETHLGEAPERLFQTSLLNFFTFCKGDEIGFCLGLDFRYAGVAEVYGVFTTNVDKDRVAYARALLKFFYRAYAKFPVHRAQLTIRATDSAANKLAQNFGFRPEGIMKKLNKDGSDYIMYGRVF
jgi:hypothetical protein